MSTTHISHALVDRDCSQVNAAATPLSPQNRNLLAPSLPTPRSLQNIHSLTPTSDLAQASRNAYIARKAAKSVTERRRQAAASKQQHHQSPSPLSSSVINVTVDATGVRIQDTPPSTATPASPTTPGLSSRKSLVRTNSSRIRNAPHQEKENCPAAPNNNMDAYFAARRRSVRDWKPHTPTATLAATPASTGPDKSQTQPAVDKWDGSMPRRHSSRSFIDRKATARRSLHPTDALLKSPEQPKPIDKENNSAANNHNLNTVNVDTTTPPAISDKVTKVSGTPPAPLPTDEKTPHEKMPDCGQWCDRCAGVGLLIAALMADREKPPNVSDHSDTSPKKAGWRSVVLGDNGKAKLASENARLAKENKTLFDIVHQLQKRFNDLRKST